MIITKSTLFLVLGIIIPLAPIFAPISGDNRSHRQESVVKREFIIENDEFRKDGKQFQIIGGDVHYFRVVPEYWEDRLIRAKALGLNTIQTYVPWNLHEPKSGQLVFDGIADIVSFIQLCKKLDLLVMLRPGPYICAEWDLGGLPAWLLAVQPGLRLRSSDSTFLGFVDRWWNVLLPKMVPFLYTNGGPIIMVQVENEFGSFGNDKAYLHHLVNLARKLIGDDVILYTTDGGSQDTLAKGTIKGDAVYSAVDFSTGDDPWPIFQLQKYFNAPGKSPPLAAEFYTGWLTHWGEKIASTDANFTARALANILSRNGSAVLYMAHGGTNFGFYSGANTGANASDYKSDLTSYDYDAPIRESGDVNNAKYKEIRRVIELYSRKKIPPVPPNNEKVGYGFIQMQKTGFLFDITDVIDLENVVASEEPVSMEEIGQMFGLLLYATTYTPKGGEILSIPEVHDKAQVFVLCRSEGNDHTRPTYVGEIKRWSNKNLKLPSSICASNMTLYILMENMGRVNYGPYIFDRKGILSSVYLDQQALHGWKMIPVSADYLQNVLKINSFTFTVPFTSPFRPSNLTYEDNIKEPAFYVGNFYVSKVKDTYLSFKGWGRGIAFINHYHIGRYWPSVGPQCNMYVPAPILKHGENKLIILELESHHPNHVVNSVSGPDFTCGAADFKEKKLGSPGLPSSIIMDNNYKNSA